MNEENTTQKIDIPEEFHSFSKKGLFDRCIECHKYLLDEGTEYFIEKAVNKFPGFDAFDVIFEYAICSSCADTMRKKISRKSMQSMEQYFSENINIQERMDIMQSNPHNPAAWMDKCMVNGTAKNELNEFQIYAHCDGKHLKLTQMPYMISGEAINSIAHLLSPETLDELDGFVNQHFGPPPELKELLPKRRVVLI